MICAVGAWPWGRNRSSKQWGQLLTIPASTKEPSSEKMSSGFLHSVDTPACMRGDETPRVIYDICCSGVT